VTQGPPLGLDVSNVVKSFGRNLVLKDVSLSLGRGQVHAVIGGNGSGRSTLVKIMAGAYKADAGTLTLGERTLALDSITPGRANDLGLRFVHQDLALVDEMTIAENVAFVSGYQRNRLGGIQWRRNNQEVAELLEHYQLRLQPTDPVAILNPVERTMVAVARALREPTPETILVLDEPTATMSPLHSARLLSDLRRLLEMGVTIALITHRIREVLEYSDRVTCLRDGRVILDDPVSSLRHVDLVRAITGSEVDVMQRAKGDARPSPGAILARTQLPSITGGATEVVIRAGEIVGFAGLAGSGRTRALGGLFGLGGLTALSLSPDPAKGEPQRSSSPTRRARWRRAPRALEGRASPASPSEAVRNGVGYVPEYRVTEALFADRSIMDNVVAPVENRYWRGFMRSAAQRRDAAEMCRSCRVDLADVRDPIAVLSGGNQQKAILARWMLARPQLLLLDEPTQGVDVGGRAQIHTLIDEQARAGLGVVMTSSDLEEICVLCDRVLVLVEGKVAAELIGPQISAEAIESLAQDTVGVELQGVP
jgi:ABC-type sugar transport system ATPase subunit